MPQLAYCYNNDGYYTHTEYCTLDHIETRVAGRDIFVLPANSCLDAPIIAKGCVAQRVSGAWVDVENHVGEKGFVNGVPTEIKEYGKRPEGWSSTPPAPTAEQLFEAMRADRDARLAATDMYLLSDYPISVDALAQVKAYRAALRALPEQPGALWPGGDIPWPVMPQI